MNIKEFLEIMGKSIPGIEADMGRQLTPEETRQIIRGAITKWNLTNPDEWLVVPAELTDDKV